MLVGVCDRNAKAWKGPKNVHLNYRPNPQATHWRSLLHDCNVSVVVTDVDEVAATQSTCDKEDSLANSLLIRFGDKRDKVLLRIMRVEDVEKNDEYYSHHRVSGSRNAGQVETYRPRL